MHINEISTLSVNDTPENAVDADRHCYVMLSVVMMNVIASDLNLFVIKHFVVFLKLSPNKKNYKIEQHALDTSAEKQLS